MKNNLNKTQYLKEGLSTTSTKKLLQLIKEESNLTWVQIEVLLEMGRPNHSEGGNPGKVIDIYRSGKRSFTTTTAVLALSAASHNNWISPIDYNEIAHELFEKNCSNELIKLDRKLVKEIEKSAHKIIASMFKHPDLEFHEMWESIDKVVGPVIKRIIIEGYLGEKLPQIESFSSVIGDPLLKEYQNNYITPEQRYKNIIDGI